MDFPSMPPIHMCAFLTAENEHLKEKINNLKQRNSQLQQSLNEQHHHDEIDSINKRLIQRNISCQTSAPWPSPQTIASTCGCSQPKLVSDDQLRLNRLLTAQNELLKKYETEIKLLNDQRTSKNEVVLNQHHYEMRLREYEQRLRYCDEQLKHKQQLERKLQFIEHKCNKYEKRFNRMKQELSVLDDGFFEEVEDLKFALQQATNLNNEYEKTVQTLTERLGISYPLTK